jgi:hypothetical protein
VSGHTSAPWPWGDNRFRQLDINSMSNSPVPVTVTFPTPNSVDGIA